MEELFLGLAIIMTFSFLMLIYRLNLRLAHYPGQAPKPSWTMVGKINGLGKFLALGGGLATLPVVVLLIFAPDTVAVEWVIYLAAFGMVALIAAVPMMIVALIWRTSLSRISMFTIVKVLFKTVQGVLQRHWRVITFSFMAVALSIFLLPVLQYVAYFFAWIVMGKLGLLSAAGDDDEYKYEEGGYYNYADDYYAQKEEEYQHEVDLGFH